MSEPPGPGQPIVLPPYVLSPVYAATPINTGWVLPTPPPPAVENLDDLADVDAPPSVVGLLERQDDQTVRPVSVDTVIAPHVNSATPHPTYDDLPSLTLIFDNGLV